MTDDKTRAIELKRQGMQNKQIARVLKRSSSTIGDWIVAAGLKRPVDHNRERNAEIERHLQAGKSNRAVSAIMGLTMNVVAGVRKRLQAQGVQFPSDSKKNGVARLASSNSMAQIRGGGTALERLGARQCRYPQGHPGDKKFSFCGAKTTGILEPYCPMHRAKCRQRKEV